MEPLCLDIESEFGAFNKAFSNTGGLLTYLFPPKTAIVGMLGAIVGYEFKDTLKTFSDIRVGVEILKGIETKTITYVCHYGERPDREKKKIPVNIHQELLINPKYRLYLDLESLSENESLLSKVKTLLKQSDIKDSANDINGAFRILFQNQISYYSPYMGKNEFPLYYQLRDRKLKSLDSSDFNKYLPTNCVIPKPKDSVLNYKIESVSELAGFKLKRSEPFSFFILSDVPTTQNEKREFGNFKDFLLKDHSRKTVIEVEPKINNDYSFYKDGEGNLIVCF